MPFLALELVEGEDLAARLARGSIPIDEALGIARQIADALAEAHEKGIVHRDLKPANVKVTPDGKVKVLDFGLAKAYAEDAAPDSGAELSRSPTLVHGGTLAGVILGTAAYMAPEQATGGAVDKRADVWAFGCVLYEMLTCRRPFVGASVSDTLAEVLKGEPDWTRLPAATPPAIRRLLRRCLVKDRSRRLADVVDARLELDEARAGSPVEVGGPRPASAVARAAGVGCGSWRPRAAAAVVATLGRRHRCAGAGDARSRSRRRRRAIPARSRCLRTASRSLSPRERRAGAPCCGSGRSRRGRPGPFPAPTARCCRSGRRAADRSDSSPPTASSSASTWTTVSFASWRRIPAARRLPGTPTARSCFVPGTGSIFPMSCHRRENERP